MDKKHVLFYKILVIGIIILFVGIAISPIITAVDKDTDDVENESREKSKIGVSDDYEEIITFISGAGYVNWIKRRGLFRGEVKLYWDEVFTKFHLFGFKRSNGGVEGFIEHDAVFIYAFRFIGSEAGRGVTGFALGNIDWHR